MAPTPKRLVVQHCKLVIIEYSDGQVEEEWCPCLSGVHDDLCKLADSHLTGSDWREIERNEQAPKWCPWRHGVKVEMVESGWVAREGRGFLCSSEH